MPLRDSAPAGAPCRTDLFTSDTTRAQTPFGRLAQAAVPTGALFKLGAAA